MKRFLMIMAVTLATLSLALAAPREKKRKAELAEVTFVTTVECKNCVKKVNASLPYEEGVKDLKIKLENQTVWIKYDARVTNVEKLAAAIKKLGFDAVELK